MHNAAGVAHGNGAAEKNGTLPGDCGVQAERRSPLVALQNGLQVLKRHGQVLILPQQFHQNHNALGGYA